MSEKKQSKTVSVQPLVPFFPVGNEPPTNPKHKASADKPPLALIPPVALELEALAFADGETKYSRKSWRRGASVEVYLSAAMRHMHKWAEGITHDDKSGQHHLGHARACLAILIDAEVGGSLIKDLDGE